MASGGQFPTVEDAQEVREAFGHENAPYDQFLEDCYVVNPEGWVSSDILWADYVKWAAAHNAQNRLHRNQIRYAIKEGSTWPLVLGRKSSGKRGLRGMSRKTVLIEVDDLDAAHYDYDEEELHNETDG